MHKAFLSPPPRKFRHHLHRAGTQVKAASGNGVQLNANGGASILVDTVVSGAVTSTLSLGGVGLGTGWVGTANGSGAVNMTVASTGNVSGTGAGLIGTAVNGNVTLVNNGQINQTAAGNSSSLNANFLLLPVGMGGAATGTGNVALTTAVGSSVTQAGHQAITGIEGVGVFASTLFGSGAATITAAGSVTATGIGLWSNANSGTAVATSNGVVNVGGGAGNLSAFIPSEPITGAVLLVSGLLTGSGNTVGIAAQSVTNAATASLIAVVPGGASVGSVSAPTWPGCDGRHFWYWWHSEGCKRNR